jgi:Na+/proline symporter
MEMQDQNSSLPQEKYISGVCNIGPEERKRRRNGAIYSGILTIAEIIILSVFRVNPLWRLTLFIPAASLGVGFLQWYNKFCVAFGLMGVFNFGDIGTTFSVEQRQDLKRDRTKARRMILLGIVFGLICAVCFYFLHS